MGMSRARQMGLLFGAGRKTIPIAISILLPGLLLAGETQTLRMKVEHLMCEDCAQKVRAGLSSVCKELSIDVKKGEALCKYEAPVTLDEILFKANKTGFRSSRID